MDPLNPFIISIAAFVAVAALVGGVAFLMRDFGSTSAEDRLATMTGRRRKEGEVTKDQIVKDGVGGLASMFGGLA